MGLPRGWSHGGSHQNRKGTPLQLSFPTLLGLLFIGLKLANVIDWSWWWVLAPFWLGFVIVFVV